MSISNFLENELLDAVFNADVGTLPIENVYVKLHLGDPGEDGTANADGETTRKEMTAAAAAGDGTISNDNTISWTTIATVDGSDDISHISLWDHVSAGNCLWTGALTATKTVNTGDTLTIAVGDLDVTLS